MGKRLVIALGGNALGSTPEQQLELVKKTASTIADLVEDGVEAKVVILNGEVFVNGEVDTRRGRKLYDGDIVEYNGETIEILK